MWVPRARYMTALQKKKHVIKLYLGRRRKNISYVFGYREEGIVLFVYLFLRRRQKQL